MTRSGHWRHTVVDRPGLVAAAVVAAMAGGWWVGSPAAVVGPPLVAAGARHWAQVTLHKNERARAAALTLALVDALIQQLRGGRSLAQAVRSVTEWRSPGPGALSAANHPALSRLRAGLNAGAGLEVALARASGWAPGGPARSVPGLGDDGLGLTFAALLVLVQRGGPALPALERLDDTLRSAHWVEQEARVQTAQATTSAVALAAVPVLFAAALALLDPDLARFYCFEPLGAVCLTVSGLLSYLSWWWMHRIIWRAP